MKRQVSLILVLVTLFSMWTVAIPVMEAAANTETASNEEMDYMYLKNIQGPSGVALGGIGVGYYQIDPTGKFTRNCVNNIHKSFADSPNGFIVGAWDGATATRLQRDGGSLYGMQGYADSYYTGLWPYMNIDFKNSTAGVADMSFSAYSGLQAHNVKNSSLPVVYYDVVLTNNGGSAKNMSALLTWGDLIGRGMRDSDKAELSDKNGESADWYDMPTPQTYAKGVQVSQGGTTYTGVMQYAKGQLLPKRATFQNYNNAFMILAEDTANTEVTILKNFDVNNGAALSSYTTQGRLNNYDGGEVGLSAPTNGARTTSNGSAVAVSTTVPAGGKVTVKLMVSWFAPEMTEDQYAAMHRFSTCDFNKYYHNSFSSIQDMTAYAIGIRDAQRQGIAQWQDPILNSSMPEWLQFKQINSGYTLYTCGVLNKRGNFSTLEGEMGGYGGTMDQKMSSYPVYEKLFPQLNLTENRQFANVTGANGEIQHFDIHYYYGMADYENTDNPTPAGSMIDNTGTWMMQMWNHYRQTGSKEDLQKYYSVMKNSLTFLQSRYISGTHIPSYHTTYDDYSHPQVMVYSGTVWLHMLDLAQKWANLMGDTASATAYAAEYAEAFADVELYYGAWSADLGYDAFYAYGSDAEFISSNGQSGTVESPIMFSGAMAGQFISRMTGQGDVVPFDQFVSHMKTFLQTSVQQSSDYMAPKVYNLRTEQSLDWLSSNCWPFYLESYGGMAAIQAGYLEDGLEILEHTSLVDLRLGYTWTRSLWTRAYITYMTAPVSWMIGDVLAGASVDAPAHTLTLGPSCIASEGVGVGDRLSVTLYYPKYWATVNYNLADGTFTYQIIETFYDNGEAPITIDHVIASPAGVQTDEATTITLNTPFTVQKGATLDLSAHTEAFRGVVKEKLLQPVPEYQPPQAEMLANGTGLATTITANGTVLELPRTESVNFCFNQDNLPAEGVDGAYTMTLSGTILPKYSQKYQLIFEYTGADSDLQIEFGGQIVTEYGDSLSDVESQQFNPTQGCKLRVITLPLNGSEHHQIKITYKGNVADGQDDVLRFLWWSTTQQMGLVIRERMYPIMKHNDMIRGVEFSDATCREEEDHVAYTTTDTYAIYNNIDFGEGGKRFSFKIHYAAILNETAQGGTLEIRRNDKAGELLGSMTIQPTSEVNWIQYAWATTTLYSEAGLSGLVNICLAFHPNVINGYLINYDQFTFACLDNPQKKFHACDTIDGKDYSEATAQIEGDHMAWTAPNTYAMYSGIDFDVIPKVFEFVIMAGAISDEHSTGGTMELRLDGPSGELLGTMTFTPTGAWDKYEEQRLKLNRTLSGVHNLCLVFRPNSEFLFNYTTFTFEAAEQSTAFEQYTNATDGIFHLGVENANSDDANWTDYRYVAQEIVPASSFVHGAKLALNLTGGEAVVHMELRSLPSGTPLAVTEQPIQSKGNGMAWYDVPFDEAVGVKAYRPYYLVYYLAQRTTGNLCIVHGANLGPQGATHPGCYWQMSSGSTIDFTAGENHLMFGFQLMSSTEAQEVLNQTAAQQVIDQIAGLDGTQATVTAAREAYDALTSEQQELVTNYQVLLDAEDALNTLTHYGDVDGDGQITAVDALMVLQSVVSNITLTQEQTVRADVNGNQMVEAIDVLAILGCVVGKVTQFPVEAK